MTKILIIEDTKSVLESIKLILKLENYEVLEASNGKEGIESAINYLPDLIICDIMMPLLNGYDVLETLRQDNLTSSIPFIFLTAKATNEDFRKGMTSGADDYIAKPFTSEELVLAVKTRIDKYKKLSELNNEKLLLLEKELEKEKESALSDPLTGANNRRGFFQKAEIELSRARRHKYPVTLVYLDLDNFKKINDTFGHETGDIILKKISDITLNNIRTTDIFSRFGGDEFVIMFPEADNEKGYQIIKRINSIFLEYMSENKWPVTLSISIITFNKLDLPILDMINYADKYMYKAKIQGKNKIYCDILN